ncbi:hypothetical protein AB4144_17525 [Rhizobiaceae sp. 2RAB30]
MAYNWDRGPTRLERYGKTLAVILMIAAVGAVAVYSGAFAS